jgi:hypothetical protein
MPSNNIWLGELNFDRMLARIEVIRNPIEDLPRIHIEKSLFEFSNSFTIRWRVSK